MFLKKYKLYPVILFSLFSFPQLMHAQTDSLFLTVDQLFERGVQSVSYTHLTLPTKLEV